MLCRCTMYITLKLKSKVKSPKLDITNKRNFHKIHVYRNVMFKLYSKIFMYFKVIKNYKNFLRKHWKQHQSLKVIYYNKTFLKKWITDMRFLSSYLLITFLRVFLSFSNVLMNLFPLSDRLDLYHFLSSDCNSNKPSCTAS